MAEVVTDTLVVENSVNDRVVSASEIKKELQHNGTGLEELKNVIFKLLDKAGHDPRLTPRRLRAKAEERLFGKENGAGKLKEKRELIKDLIVNWSEAQKAKEVAKLKALMEIAKAAGIVTVIMKGVAEMSHLSERIAEVTKRLREKGLQFSDHPTAEEIGKISAQTALKKDLDGIDTSLIIENKKRKAAESVTSSGSNVTATSAAKKVATESAVKVKTEVANSATVSVKTEKTTTSNTAAVKQETTAASSPTRAAKPKVQYSKEEDEAEF